MTTLPTSKNRGSHKCSIIAKSRQASTLAFAKPRAKFPFCRPREFHRNQRKSPQKSQCSIEDQSRLSKIPRYFPSSRETGGGRPHIRPVVVSSELRGSRLGGRRHFPAPEGLLKHLPRMERLMRSLPALFLA